MSCKSLVMVQPPPSCRRDDQVLRSAPPQLLDLGDRRIAVVRMMARVPPRPVLGKVGRGDARPIEKRGVSLADHEHRRTRRDRGRSRCPHPRYEVRVLDLPEPGAAVGCHGATAPRRRRGGRSSRPPRRYADSVPRGGSRSRCSGQATSMRSRGAPGTGHRRPGGTRGATRRPRCRADGGRRSSRFRSGESGGRRDRRDPPDHGLPGLRRARTRRMGRSSRRSPETAPRAGGIRALSRP